MPTNNRRDLDALTNVELIAELDRTLLEVERRLYNYEKLASGVLEAADEGLVFAIRVDTRLEQTNYRADKTRRALDHVGVGNWDGDSYHCNPDPRYAEETADEGGES